LKRRNYSELQGEDEYFWSQWAIGPGALYQTCEDRSVNHDAICDAISSIWEEAVVRAWFVLYTIRAAIFRQKPYIIHKDYSFEPVTLGGSPVMIVESKAKTVQVKSATTLSHYDEFVEYAKQAPRGFTGRAINDVKLFKPFFELGGIRIHDQLICLHQADLRSRAKKKREVFISVPALEHPTPWDDPTISGCFFRDYHNAIEDQI